MKRVFGYLSLFLIVRYFSKGGDQQKKMQEQQQAMEDMMNGVLSQVLSQEARARRESFICTSPDSTGCA